MIEANRYYEQIVKPTVEDFVKSNRDLRLGMLACMATFHVVDYVFQNRILDAKKADQEARRFCDKMQKQNNNAFEIVRGFALASKHCRLSRTDSLQGFDSGRTRPTYPSIAGVMRTGATYIGDTEGGLLVEWIDGRKYKLHRAIEKARQTLEHEFPELTQ
ncbi:hypothetical protein V6C03_14600 [Methyloligella sp. 2.7D]|uniref:hypothetical protein n=1 Tax=unclassified Methyloligella TaxID=2625955 RepID=UPI00157C1C78|nr:hypothetical protein [Methyloligella sp. GL2]QKP77018.1 hypothetical protein HT051_05865 [Methyloligella sp. GL2]